ncbi:MAG: hypothetical protein O2888_05295 [Chloroflexi bacterium]|nr:hypothetical protein [Chloroflexota bacterium]
MSNLDSFSDRQPRPGGGWWTAEYDALDQRNDLAFFIVTRDDGAEFFVEVDTGGPDRVAEGSFREYLRQTIAALAQSGEPNTTHDGTWSTKTKLQAQGRSVASKQATYSGIFD